MLVSSTLIIEFILKLLGDDNFDLILFARTMGTMRKAFLRLCWWSVLGAAVFEGWIDWRRKEWSRWSCWRFLNVIDVSTGRCIRLGLMLVIRIDSGLQAIRIGIPFSALCIWKINNKIFCIWLGNHKLKIRSYFIEQYFCFKCIII